MDNTAPDPRAATRKLWGMLNPEGKSQLSRSEFTKAVETHLDASLSTGQFLTKILPFLGEESDLIRYELFETAFLQIADSLVDGEEDKEEDDEEDEDENVPVEAGGDEDRELPSLATDASGDLSGVSQLEQLFKEEDRENRGCLHYFQFRRLLQNHFKRSEVPISDEKIDEQIKELWASLGKDSSSSVTLKELIQVLQDSEGDRAEATRDRGYSSSVSRTAPSLKYSHTPTHKEESTVQAMKSNLKKHWQRNLTLIELETVDELMKTETLKHLPAELFANILENVVKKRLMVKETDGQSKEHKDIDDTLIEKEDERALSVKIQKLSKKLERTKKHTTRVDDENTKLSSLVVSMEEQLSNLQKQRDQEGKEKKKMEVEKESLQAQLEALKKQQQEMEKKLALSQRREKEQMEGLKDAVDTYTVPKEKPERIPVPPKPAVDIHDLLKQNFPTPPPGLPPKPPKTLSKRRLTNSRKSVSLSTILPPPSPTATAPSPRSAPPPASPTASKPPTTVPRSTTPTPTPVPRPITPTAVPTTRPITPTPAPATTTTTTTTTPAPSSTSATSSTPATVAATTTTAAITISEPVAVVVVATTTPPAVVSPTPTSPVYRSVPAVSAPLVEAGPKPIYDRLASIDRLEYSQRSEEDNGGPTPWQPNDLYNDCQICKEKFGVLRRRHHCRSCGRVVCSKCSPFKQGVRGYATQEVRVCVECTTEETRAKHSKKPISPAVPGPRKGSLPFLFSPSPFSRSKENKDKEGFGTNNKVVAATAAAAGTGGGSSTAISPSQNNFKERAMMASSMPVQSLLSARSPGDGSPLGSSPPETEVDVAGVGSGDEEDISVGAVSKGGAKFGSWKGRSNGLPVAPAKD